MIPASIRGEYTLELWYNIILSVYERCEVECCSGNVIDGLLPHPTTAGNERLRVEELPPEGTVTARLVRLAAEEPEAYFWLAAESTRVTAWRRALIDAGLSKDQVQFSGYWKRGRPQR